MPRTLAPLLVRVAVLTAALLAPGPVVAQGPPGPALPVGMDLRAAPLGGYAQYDVTVVGMPPFKQRFALVARDAATSSVEMTSEGGSMGGAGKVVVKVVLDNDLSRTDRLKKLIMQLGDNEPMELRLDPGAQKDQFARVDPRKLVGSARLKVAAGTFKTRHYKDRGSNGAAVEVWTSDEAPPFGIVRLKGSVSGGPGGAAHPVTMELTGRGRDARAQVTRAPQAFNPQVLMGQMTRSLSAGGAPPGAPAPARAPSSSSSSSSGGGGTRR